MTTRLRKPSLFTVIAGGWISAAVLAALFVSGVFNDPPETVSSQVIPPAEVTLTKGSPTPSPAVDKKDADPVSPWCWASRKSAETVKCQEVVAAGTKFIGRYTSHQPDLAKAHTIVKRGPDGSREANSLSRHGLLTCWMTKERDASLDDMVHAFTYAFHEHRYTLPTDPKTEQQQTIRDAAIQIHIDALQAICPSLIDEYEDKGGPVVAELAE